MTLTAHASLGRRAFVSGIGALVIVPRLASAQASRAPVRIGVLAGGGAVFDEGFAPFRERLRELGYVEGQSVTLIVRNAQGRADRYADLAKEVVGLAPSVIVVQGNGALAALQKVTRTIPIVMAVIGDPVGAGFVASLARPGGNITGLSNMGEGIAAKWLELVRDVAPKATRIGILRDPKNAAHTNMVSEVQRASRAAGLTAVMLDASNTAEFETVLGVTRPDADAVVVLPQPPASANARLIIDAMARHGLPAVYLNRAYPAAGGLMSYGPSLAGMWRGAADFVDKILKGAKPADLPVDQPTRFELIVNVKTARALGLTIPQSMLIRADRLIR